MVSEFLLGELGYTLSLYSIGNGKAWTYIVNVQCTHTLMYCTVQYLVGEHWFEVAQKSKVALPRKEKDQGEQFSLERDDDLMAPAVAASLSSNCKRPCLYVGI